MGVLALFGISLNPLSYLGSFINGMFSAALKLFGQSASNVVAALLSFITATSDPVFSGGWWSSSGEAVFVKVVTISGALMALSFMLSIITSLLAGDPKLLRKAVLHLPLAIIQTGLLVTVTAALLSATDEISSYIASGASHDLTNFVTVGMVAAIADSSIVGLIIGGLIILAAISVWLQLIVRTALLYVTVLGAPLVFAASVHPSVRGLQKRYVEFGVGLICAKVVVALAFATAAAALGSLGSSPSFDAEVGALLEALAILLVACFAPYLFVRLLIGAEALVIAEGLERRPLRAAMHTQQGSYYMRASGGLSGLLHGMGGGAKGGGSSRAGGRSDLGGTAGPGGPGGDGDGPSPNGGSPRPSSPSAPSSGVAGKTAPASGPVPAGLLEARRALRGATSRAEDHARHTSAQPDRVSSPLTAGAEPSPGGTGIADRDSSQQSRTITSSGNGVQASDHEEPSSARSRPTSGERSASSRRAEERGGVGAITNRGNANLHESPSQASSETGGSTTPSSEHGSERAPVRTTQPESRQTPPPASSDPPPTRSQTVAHSRLEGPTRMRPTEEPRS